MLARFLKPTVDLQLTSYFIIFFSLYYKNELPSRLTRLVDLEKRLHGKNLYLYKILKGTSKVRV